MNLILKLLIFAICVFITAGCSSGYRVEQLGGSGKNIPVSRVEIINSNYDAGINLLTVLGGRHPEDSPLLLTSFVNLDDFGETSTLGRIIPQQIGTRLTQNGIEVMDIRLREDSLLVKQHQGEFALSRKLQEIARDKQAHSVLVGTYSVVYNQIYVNAKILRSADGLTMAATDYVLPYDLRALDPKGFSGSGQEQHMFTPNVYTSLD